MDKLEKVIKGLECCIDETKCGVDCPYWNDNGNCRSNMETDALALLKAQEQRHRLEVNNIGNVDIPDGVTEEQFYALMNNVVAALEHTDMGESWPYAIKGGEVGMTTPWYEKIRMWWYRWIIRHVCHHTYDCCTDFLKDCRKCPGRDLPWM